MVNKGTVKSSKTSLTDTNSSRRHHRGHRHRRISDLSPAKFALDIGEVSDSDDQASDGSVEADAVNTTVGFSEFFEAIIEDDVAKLRNVLEAVPREQRKSLLTSHFEFQDQVYQKYFPTTIYSPCLPLHLAVFCGARDVIKLFLFLHLNLEGRDVRGYCILHALVAYNFYHPNAVDRAVGLFEFLEHRLHTETMKHLLMMENDDQYRPIEFAAQQGTLRLLQAMMLSETYAVEQKTIGLNTFTMIDVTDYETGDRKYKSPLFFLVHLSRKKLGQAEVPEVVHGPLFKTWKRVKLRCNIVPIIVWAVVRITILITHLAADYDSEPRIRKLRREGLDPDVELCESFRDFDYSYDAHSAFLFINLLTSLAVVIFDVGEMMYLGWKRRLRVLYDLKGFKKLIINVKFYRICEFLTMLLTIYLISVSLYTHEDLDDYHETIVQSVYFVRVVLPVFIVWSVFYFMQCLPWIGTSIISIQGMIRDMTRFAILMVIYNIPFMHLFYIFSSNESNQGCIEDFNTIGRTFYSLLLLSLNIVDPTQYDVHHEASFYFMHAVFVYVVGIVLLNFLIAVMANVQRYLEEHQGVLLTLNVLSVACYAEMRMHRLFPFFYDFVRRHNYYVTKDSRFCIILRTKREPEKVKELNTKPDDA